MSKPCRESVLTGPRAGDECRLLASVIIAAPMYVDPFYVCGYHARAYAPAVQYPLWANRAQLQRLQMDNLDRMESANEAVSSYE